MKTSFLIIAFISLSMTNELLAQNVGIGTTNPGRAKLELNGMVGNTNAIFGGDGNGIGLVASWPSVEFNAYYNNGHRYLENGYALVQDLDHTTGTVHYRAYVSGVKDAVASGYNPAITIYNNGRVGIGLYSGTDAQLDVAKDPGKDATAFFSAPQWSAFNYGSSEHTYIRGASNTGNVYFNYYAQNSKIAIGGGSSMVGINWGNPVYPLEIHAPNFHIGIMRMGSQNNWLITMNLNYLKLFFRPYSVNNNTLFQLGVFDFNGQYSSASDKRMKKQIEPLPPMLEKLMQLQPYRYQMKYNNPNHDETFGLIAQEVKQVFPWLVHATQNANTGYKDIGDVHTLNYSGFAPIVIKALQEQQSQLDQLEKRLSTLEQNQ